MVIACWRCPTQPVLLYQGNAIDEAVHTGKEPLFVALRKSIVYEADHSRVLDMVASGKYIWLDTDQNILYTVKHMNAGECALLAASATSS